MESQDDIIFNVLNTLMTNLKKILNYYLLAGISPSFHNLQDMGSMYDQACQAGKMAFFNEPHISIYTSEPYLSMKNVTLDDMKVRVLLREKQSHELESYINTLFTELKEIRDIRLFQSVFNQILELFQTYVNEHKGKDQKNLLSSSMLKEDNFEKLYDFAAVKMHILNIISLLLEKEDSEHSTQMSHIIQKSMSYIEKNYNQNISLSNLATNVEVSRNYLSFLFKQELGLNFSHYLTETRIRKAKKTSGRNQ